MSDIKLTIKNVSFFPMENSIFELLMSISGIKNLTIYREQGRVL